jgi:hypothetical protein
MVTLDFSRSYQRLISSIVVEIQYNKPILEKLKSIESIGEWYYSSDYLHPRILLI